ncbi:MAG: autotransporter-associated beta strand repeat-containing protein [Nitratireductor sp.]
MSALGTGLVTIAAGGTLDLGTNTGASALSGSGLVTLNANTLTLNGDGNGSIEQESTYAGIISGTGGLIINNGNDNQILTGDNTFSGGITVAGGALTLGSNTAAGTGSITTTGSVIGYLNGVNSAAPIIINSNTTQLQVNGADAAEQSGVISELGGPRPIEKIGTGTLTLSAANTYTGATTITAGTLRASNGSALGNNSAVTVAGGATLDLTTGLAVGSLAGAGNVTLNANSLGVGTDNTSTNFSGVISGTGGISKNGTGTQTFSGANTYSGNTVVNAGTLHVTGSIASSTQIITNGGTLIAEAGALGATTDVGLNSGTFQNNGNNTIQSLGARGRHQRRAQCRHVGHGRRRQRHHRRRHLWCGQPDQAGCGYPVSDRGQYLFGHHQR